MDTYEILSLIIGGLNSLSLLLVSIQIILSRKFEKENHEEQRRIKTVEVLNSWCASLKKETRLAEKIVEKLDEDSCKKLYDYAPFKMGEELHNMMCQMCSQYSADCSRCKPDENKKYLIDGTQLTELRGNVTNYLNNLETVAVAWQQGIVDKEAVELQFSYLYTPGTKSALCNYRKIAGRGNSFPVLNEFYKKIQDNNSATVQQKIKQ